MAEFIVITAKDNRKIRVNVAAISRYADVGQYRQIDMINGVGFGTLLTLKELDELIVQSGSAVCTLQSNNGP